MLIYILLAPFGAFAIGMLFGRQLGRIFPYIAATSITISTMLSIKALILLNNQSNFDLIREFYLFKWISVESLDIKWALSFNNITCVMLVVVTVISAAVYIFSLEYMKEDPHLIRYMSYLCLFTFCMLILITATNLLQMFVGWEGVGVSSYLLINFWFTRLQANKAAIKAMVVNRIGDFFILLALFIIYAIYGTLDYNILASVSWYHNPVVNIFGNIEIKALEIICLFILFGALGKSAQLGLHTWLPDAMEGPTPVSALIHAATMVTAGVFLIIRTSFLFECAPNASNMVTLLGATTAFFAAVIALFQNDMKKIVAYSTCSQIGYMMYICGLGGYDVGIFHLSNHAYFKALLFLGSASVIHAMSDEQDMRKMGGLKELLPFTYIIFLYASLALAGFPYLTGFYSKDIILEIAFAKHTTIGHFGFILGIFAAACTAYYSTRLIHQVFLDNPNGNKQTTFKAHEGGFLMTLPMLFLVFCSIVIGYLLKDMLIGQGTDFWKNSIIIKTTNYSATDIEFIPLSIKFIPLITTLSAIACALFIYRVYRNNFFLIKQKHSFKNIYTFFNKKWFIDRLYNEFVAQTILHQSYTLFYQHIDRGLIEFITAHRITHFINATITFISLNNRDKLASNVNTITIITIFLVTIFVGQNILF